jgi:hypothetical protein
LEDLIVSGGIILKQISKRMRSCGLDSSGSGYEQVKDSYENSNESLGSMAFWAFLDLLIFCRKTS